MSGLFYTFNIAKRGMSAQQTSLHVTSHNVSNVNTQGYSRQRAIHKTTQPFPMPALNNPVGPGQLGTGVEVSEITRARDEFIDNSIRRETSSLLNYATRNQFLNSVEAIVNEPGDTGLSKALTKFWDAWQGLSTNTENSTTKKLVISNSNALGDSFKQTYTQLEELEKELSQLERDKIFEVNSILGQVGELNEQIKQITINGQAPNDLMDRRDMLLDTLSKNINFKLEKGDFNSIRVVTKDGNGSERYLVSDSKVINGIASIDDVSFKIDGKDINKADFPLNFKIGTPIAPQTKPPTISFPIDINFKVYIDGDVNRPSVKTVEINNTDDLKKYFNTNIEVDNIRIDSIKNQNLLYSKGTKDLNSAIQNAEPFDFTNGAIKGLEKQKLEISDYKNQINNMVRTISVAVNTIHSNGNTDTTAGERYINFFNNIEGLDHPAKGLKVNEVIEKNPSKINAGAKMENPDSGDNYRAKRIAELRNMRFDVSSIKNSKDFLTKIYGFVDTDFDVKGNLLQMDDKYNLAKAEIKQSSNGDTIDTYYKGMIAQLGVSAQEAKRVVENQQQLLLQLNTQKESVSGVSVDEEMIDMLQFQRAYQANAKMINVVDELLDLVVNRLIR
ncbi:MAG: flagellar hook-associated protein FlgK [Clostridium sp.]